MFRINIDGNTKNTAPNSIWKGFGFISANNSSRLLLDYRAEHPNVYYTLLKWFFDPYGAVKMNHLKLEMGSDINSSSGTEPSTMRFADEIPDATRGAGFRLAADAKKINPDLTLELLSWGVPSFVKNAPTVEESYRLRYKWFKRTLDLAYETYGLKFDYIDPNINERRVEAEWIKYFSCALKSEKNTPYDYSGIKLVAADEEAAFNLAGDMLSDNELMAAVDVIGVHYISASDENTKKCKNEYGKELWYSEGLPPASVDKYSGLGGVNSMLDVAGRIINMYPSGGYTMYEFQPPVSAYYGGACYCPKQLVTANEPWSGYLDIGAGMYLCEHFALFSGKGWQFIDSACYGDGTENHHLLLNTINNYMTLCDPETDDYSVILANNTAVARKYKFAVSNLAKASYNVYMWETRKSDKDKPYDSNYMKRIMTITPQNKGDEYTYSLTVKPFSLVTVSTLNVKPIRFKSPKERSFLPLPYTDDFEYTEYDGDYLKSRGGAPRYTTDIGGAFEVVKTENGNVLMQKINEELRGLEWGYTPEPVTTLGDDRWANYTASVKIKLDKDGNENNYAGVGLRYINASAPDSRSGYRLEITQNGGWRLCRLRDVIREGKLSNFDANKWHSLSITANEDKLSAAVDDVLVADVTLSGAVTFSGRVALFSAYFLNCFDKLAVTPAGKDCYIERTDCLDNTVRYFGEWEYNTMDSFTFHNRTSAKIGGGKTGGFECEFTGTSLAFIGKAENAVITVTLDEKTVAERETVNGAADKSAIWHKYSLEYSHHKLNVAVHSGDLILDTIEYGFIP